MQRFIVYSHQGTHVDALKHMFRYGATIDEIPLERFVGTAVTLSIPKNAGVPITADDLEKAKPQVEAGDIVLLQTGFEAKYGTDEYCENPYLDESAAEWLVSKSVKMIGIDTPSVDMPSLHRLPTFNFSIHRRLLSNWVLIIENLWNLSAVAGQRLTVIAFPLKIIGADGSPARVMALIEEG